MKGIINRVVKLMWFNKFYKWFGGYFDGKGSIILDFFVKGKKKIFAPSIYIYGKKETLEYIQENFFILFRLERVHYTKGRGITPKRDGNRLVIRKKELIKAFCEKMKDYVIEKKPQIQLMLKFLNQYGIRRRKSMSDYEFYDFIDMVKEMSILNEGKVRTSINKINEKVRRVGL